MKTAIFFPLCAAIALVAPAYSETADFVCPSGENAREWFASGRLSELPNYSEAAGARVQRQHPETYLSGQAKFIAWGESSAGFCQYSNHVGLVATIVIVGASTDLSVQTKADGSYWREEYANSTPDEDEAGKEFLFVCMKNENAITYPSTQCSFSKPE